MKKGDGSGGRKGKIGGGGVEEERMDQKSVV